MQPAPMGMVQQGPIVQVTLSPDPNDAAAIAAAGGIPNTIVNRLMVDTGAQCTSLEDVVCRALGLVPIRYTKVMGVSGKAEDYPVYRMSIVIGMQEDGSGAGAQAQFLAAVVGTPSPPNPLTHVGLLGRDFLQNVRLLYDGPKGEFELVDYRHVSRPPQRMPKPAQLAGWKQIENAHRRGQKRHKKQK